MWLNAGNSNELFRGKRSDGQKPGNEKKKLFEHKTHNRVEISVNKWATKKNVETVEDGNYLPP